MPSDSRDSDTRAQKVAGSEVCNVPLRSYSRQRVGGSDAPVSPNTVDLTAETYTVSIMTAADRYQPLPANPLLADSIRLIRQKIVVMQVFTPSITSRQGDVRGEKVHAPQNALL